MASIVGNESGDSEEKSSIQKHANWGDIALAAKFAAVWLDKVESRKQEREKLLKQQKRDAEAKAKKKKNKKKKDGDGEDSNPDGNDDNTDPKDKSKKKKKKKDGHDKELHPNGNDDNVDPKDKSKKKKKKKGGNGEDSNPDANDDDVIQKDGLDPNHSNLNSLQPINDLNKIEDQKDKNVSDWKDPHNNENKAKKKKKEKDTNNENSEPDKFNDEDAKLDSKPKNKKKDKSEDKESLKPNVFDSLENDPSNPSYNDINPENCSTPNDDGSSKNRNENPSSKTVNPDHHGVPNDNETLPGKFAPDEDGSWKTKEGLPESPPSPTPEWELTEDNVWSEGILARGDRISGLNSVLDSLKPFREESCNISGDEDLLNSSATKNDEEKSANPNEDQQRESLYLKNPYLRGKKPPLSCSRSGEANPNSSNSIPDMDLSSNNISTKGNSIPLFSTPFGTQSTPKRLIDPDQYNSWMPRKNSSGIDDSPTLGQFLTAYPELKHQPLSIPPEMYDIWRNYLRQSRKDPDPDETRKMRGYAWCWVCGELLVRALIEVIRSLSFFAKHEFHKDKILRLGRFLSKFFTVNFIFTIFHSFCRIERHYR